VLVIVCKPTPGSNAVSPCHQLQYWEDWRVNQFVCLKCCLVFIVCPTLDDSW
jgi:hypothetical protein